MPKERRRSNIWRMILKLIYENQSMCVLDAAGLEESKNSDFRKSTKLSLRKRGNVAIGVCKGDCRVNVIRAATE